MVESGGSIRAEEARQVASPTLCNALAPNVLICCLGDIPSGWLDCFPQTAVQLSCPVPPAHNRYFSRMVSKLYILYYDTKYMFKNMIYTVLVK